LLGAGPMLGSAARRLRSLAAVVATLLLFAQVSLALHAVLVHHTVCAEHGELVHATEARSVDRHAAPGRVSAVPAEPPAAHEHGHCLLGRRASDGVSLAPPAVCCAIHAPELVASGLAEASAHSSRLILFYSPKQSPPV